MDNEEILEIEERIVFFEKDYEDVKKDPNKIWKKYEDKIIKVINTLSRYKNFDKEELIQQAYIYYIDFCKIYDPYYNGGFIPFDKFIFKNLIIKLRAFIQRYYFKRKREQPTEFSEYMANQNAKNNILDADEKIYAEYLYSLITKRQQLILDLSLQGHKQQEIGDLLKISQSRVSVIKKKTLIRLNEMLQNNGKIIKKKKKF